MRAGPSPIANCPDALMSAWDRITATLASEFSDVADLESFVRVVVRLLVAALLGGLLGLQREQHGKEAGVRTHMLVALGSALFVLVPLQAGTEPDDISRVIQGVIAGVGFLCAGTILRITGEDQVRSEEHTSELQSQSNLVCR